MDKHIQDKSEELRKELLVFEASVLSFGLHKDNTTRIMVGIKEALEDIYQKGKEDGAKVEIKRLVIEYLQQNDKDIIAGVDFSDSLGKLEKL